VPYHNKSIQGWSQLRQAGKPGGNPEKRGTGSLKWMNSTWWWHSSGSKEQRPGALSSSGGADLRALSLKGSESVKGRGRECF